MRTVVAGILTIVALASMESALGRWLPLLPFVPIVLPLLLGASFSLPHRALFRLTLLGASAAELNSGLPPGITFVATLLPPHALLGLNRQPRPDLPWSVRAGMSALATFTVLALLGVPAWWAGPIPRHFFLPFFLLRLILPTVIAGGIAAIVLPLLQRERARSFLRVLGVPLP